MRGNGPLSSGEVRQAQATAIPRQRRFGSAFSDSLSRLRVWLTATWKLREADGRAKKLAKRTLREDPKDIFGGELCSLPPPSGQWARLGYDRTIFDLLEESGVSWKRV